MRRFRRPVVEGPRKIFFDRTKPDELFASRQFTDLDERKRLCTVEEVYYCPKSGNDSATPWGRGSLVSMMNNKKIEGNWCWKIKSDGMA